MKLYSTLILSLALFISSCSNGENKTEANTDTSSTSTDQVELIIPDGKYSLIKIQPTIKWEATKLNGSSHDGTISATQGKIKVEGGVTSGMMTLDMNSFTCTDLDGEDRENFDSHLKSEDFLDVAQYPKADIKITGLKQMDGKHSASIKLFLHGGIVDYETPVKVKEVELEDGGKGYMIAGVLMVDRTKHKIIYGSGSFFDNLGDRAINDEVKISFSFTAI